MIFPITFILGAIIGWRRAAGRGGNWMDQLQYATIYGIIAIILTLAAVALANIAGLF